MGGSCSKCGSEEQDIELQDLQSELESKYKPIFNEYGEDGMPISDLKGRLKKQGVTDHMQSGRLGRLIVNSDKDVNQRVNYEEFVGLVSTDGHELFPEMKLSPLQKGMRFAVSTAAPTRATRNGIFMNDYMSEYDCKPPLFIIFISLAQLAVSIYYAVELSKTEEPMTLMEGLPYDSPLLYGPGRRHEAWRFFTYMFVHYGWIHLVSNLFMQLLIGIPLEMVHKFWRVALVYILGVAAGSMSSSVFDPKALLAGASGGVYALMGAHFANTIMNWSEMRACAPIRLTVWAILAALDTGLSMYQRYGLDDTSVSYVTHIGGAAAGVLLGISLLNLKFDKKCEYILLAVSLSIYAAWVIFSVCWNVFYDGYPEADKRECCPDLRYI